MPHWLSENRVTSTFLGMFLLLICGSAIRMFLLWRGGWKTSKKHLGSLAVWWILLLLLAAALYAGLAGVVLFFALASLLSLHEYRRLVKKSEPARGIKSRLLSLALFYGIVPLAYGAIYFGQPLIFLGLAPAVIALGIPVRFVLAERTRGFTRSVGAWQLGILLLVFSLGHAALLYLLPKNSNPVAGAAGWLLFLVLLTELNDIAQALWGRIFGRRKLAPRISPGKTVEGFALGLTTTMLAAIPLAWSLTPLASHPPWSTPPWLSAFLWPALAGLLIGVGGLLGDLTISAIKRDAKVKDSGSLLPGQGGILDRVDSLTFTAPLFYYFLFSFYT